MTLDCELVFVQLASLAIAQHHQFVPTLPSSSEMYTNWKLSKKIIPFSVENAVSEK